MKKALLLSLMALVAFACAEDPTNDTTIDMGGDTPDTSVDVVDNEKIYASISWEDSPTAEDFTDSTPQSRVELNGDGVMNMAWTEGDRVRVFGPETNKEYLFDGKTGDRSGSFTLDSEDEPLVYNFNKYYYASTPYGTFRKDGMGLMLISPESGTIVQNYVSSDRHAINANMAVGTSTDGENFKFKCILGYLRLSLKGEKRVKSIELINNSFDKIAGQHYIYVENPQYVLWWSNASTTSNIILDCGEGVELSDTPTDFYFAIKPTTLSSGFTVIVYFTDGTCYSRSTSNSILIEQNSIQPMKALEVSDNGYRYMTITHTNSAFTVPVLTDKDENTVTSGFINYGDGEMTTLDKASKHSYNDDKASHTVKINNIVADKVVFSSCVGITEIDLSTL